MERDKLNRRGTANRPASAAKPTSTLSKVAGMGYGLTLMVIVLFMASGVINAFS